jgi:hypothetical protein
MGEGEGGGERVAGMAEKFRKKILGIPLTLTLSHKGRGKKITFDNTRRSLRGGGL